jgi:hypothetical protein
MAVRALVEGDIPQIAGLYWNYMRLRKGPPPAALVSLFHELYFESPFTSDDFASLVYDVPDHGIVGFLGGSVRQMSVCGRPIRVMFGGNLVVHPDYRSGLVAPRIVNTFRSNNYDLAMVDSANNISKQILQRLGYAVIPALNIHWRRPLSPVQYGIYGVAVSASSSLLGIMAHVAQPLCRVADAVASRIPANPFRQREPRLQGTELDLETLLNCMVQFRKGYSIYPEYSLESLGWLMNWMKRQTFRGTLRKIVLRDRSQKIVGWYIYYAKPGAIGEVVQIGGYPNITKDILDHLFCDAQQQGVIGLHGVVDSRRIPDFSDKGCFFTCRGGWSFAYSPNPEVMQMLERGDAFLSRLDGEWCLDPGE